MGDLDQNAALLLGIALNRGDQIGDQVRAALILRLNIGERGLGLLFLGGNIVDAAGSQSQGQQNGQHQALEP